VPVAGEGGDLAYGVGDGRGVLLEDRVVIAGDLRADPDVRVAGDHRVEAGADQFLLVAQVAEIARQGVGVLGRDSQAAARLENIARFSDFISESILRAAEQVREVLYTKPETRDDTRDTTAAGSDRG
jgi:hypothetical protein